MLLLFIYVSMGFWIDKKTFMRGKKWKGIAERAYRVLFLVLQEGENIELEVTFLRVDIHRIKLVDIKCEYMHSVKFNGTSSYGIITVKALRDIFTRAFSSKYVCAIYDIPFISNHNGSQRNFFAISYHCRRAFINEIFMMFFSCELRKFRWY